LPANRPTRARLRSILTLLVTLAIPAGAIADSIAGQAVAVLDGDTFEIRDSANIIQRVRLSQIDAPEKH
jgi:endonuclease YncB( thermonuclease family)